jgi:hypothetical protein
MGNSDLDFYIRIMIPPFNTAHAIDSPYLDSQEQKDVCVNDLIVLRS